MHGNESIITAINATALWQDLVREGEQRCGAQLDENSESWLVFTLMRHLGSTGLAEPAMALTYLEALHTAGSAQRSLALQDVGERCLLIAGSWARVPSASSPTKRVAPPPSCMPASPCSSPGWCGCWWSCGHCPGSGAGSPHWIDTP
jgi:hypothetical protein